MRSKLERAIPLIAPLPIVAAIALIIYVLVHESFTDRENRPVLPPHKPAIWLIVDGGSDYCVWSNNVTGQGQSIGGERKFSAEWDKELWVCWTNGMPMPDAHAWINQFTNVEDPKFNQ